MGGKRRVRRVIGILALGATLAILGPAWVSSLERQRKFEASRARLMEWGVSAFQEPNLRGPLEPLRGRISPQIVNYFSGSDGNQISAWGSRATKAQLAETLAVEPLRTVMLGGAANLDDSWIAAIRTPSSMAMLCLDGTAITDRSMDKLARMENLRMLSVVDTALSDVALDRLLKLPNLDQLFIGGPNIRAVRLVDHRVLDDSGLPAVRSGSTLHIEGRVEMPGLPGAASQVRVMVRPPGDKQPWEVIPYGWNARLGGTAPLDRASDGTLTFRVDMAGIPIGSSRVEVWVDYFHKPDQAAPGVTHPRNYSFRLKPFTIDLAPPAPGSSEPESGVAPETPGT